MIWHLSLRALIRVKMLYPIDEIAMVGVVKYSTCN